VSEEARRRELEAFGALELSCVDSLEPALDSSAHYLVSADHDPQAYCNFFAQALPALRRKGFQVEVSPDFPYQVLDAEPAWYIDVQPIGERVAWFDCELGILIGGERVSLLSPLIELLESAPEQSRLNLLSVGPARALPVGDGRYVCVPGTVLARVLSVLRVLYGEREQRVALRVHRSHALVLEELVGALDESSGSEVRRYGGRELSNIARQLAVSDELVRRCEAPAGLVATLRPYQTEGVRWMQRLSDSNLGGVLADDMGLGKTLQTIAHLCLLHSGDSTSRGPSDPSTLPSLVVVPTSLVGNWQKELRRFAPHLRVVIWHGADRQSSARTLADAQIIITTYALLIRDQERWQERPLRALILDEAQAIKNPRSAARRAACTLQAQHRLCLSGTPVENHLGDLWSLFDFLSPGLLGDERAFARHYRVPVEQERNQVQLMALRQLVAPFILRRRKDQVAKELPPKTLIVKRVRVEGVQRELYESLRVAAHSEVRSTIRRRGIAQSTIAILDALMKLRQVCCDPRLLRSEMAGDTGPVPSAKSEAFFELLTGLLSQGRRVLVFSQFTKMLDLMAAGLQERGIGYLLLTGESRDRQAKVDAFEAKVVDVFLISLKAGGTGLNLTSADAVIHYDPWWNPAAQAQATDRAYRIGQQKPVFVYDLIVEGSVEERMLGLQRGKQELAHGLVEGGPTTFDDNVVSELFAPLAEDGDVPESGRICAA
jgi:SNF2 family DNA or RNA helicase